MLSPQAPLTVIALAMSVALVACGRASEPAPPAAPASPAEAKVSPTQVDEVMRLWRTSIESRDPDGVQICDAAFRDRPADFVPALVASARSDADDRVRAFSTRVLGKLRDPALASVFEGLRADRNQHVRGNARWALEQLAAAQTARATR